MSSASLRRQRILDQIARAADVAQRDPEAIRLVAVSKTRDAAAIEALIDAGQSEFGENRVQEAEAKWPPLLERFPHVRLHGIGQLQSNKAEAAVRLFSAIHSLDRPSLLAALAREAKVAGRAPETFVQVNIGDEPQKGGVAIAALAPFLEQVRATPLPLAGLMCIPPAEPEPGPFFALLAKLARRHDVGGLSIGMSADFPTAMMLGATVLRVGTAFFED
ncbi:YggS family pyridoxal phosphate-dependent enzyme [Sphingomonas ginkgonis]|uniref:Pyridoxal phosphate homeostasis protein n=1 Tax=Sphingomonas ginkgonis TaxID=2315330 RepID=A0A429V726_9SPHN|nr:YggS family pyridoxal phosphate-dependent enzyme [Sphingomonas ginkgonis]RST29743.1 YggS family pyridoxal phosphate-dependent enzyme [Sphingomonas ginkgonis]